MTKILKLHFITFFFLLTPVIHAAESVRKRYEEEILKAWFPPSDEAAEYEKKRLKEAAEYEEKIPKGGSLTFWASHRKPEDIVDGLRTGRISPNLQDDDGTTLIIWAACCKKDEKMTKLLIELNANPDLQDCDGRNALMGASQLEREDIVKMLLDGDANPDLEDRDGNSALLHAAQGDADNEIHRNRNIVKLLLKGSDIYSQDYKKRKKSCTYTPTKPSFREMVLEEMNRRKKRTVKISPFLIHKLMHKRNAPSEITPSEITPSEIADIILRMEGSKPVESRALVNPTDSMAYAPPNSGQRALMEEFPWIKLQWIVGVDDTFAHLNSGPVESRALANPADSMAFARRLKVFVGDDDIDVFMDYFVDDE